MANADQIRALLKSHIDNDETRFYSVVMQVAANEAKKGNIKFATELKKMIDQARERKSSFNLNKGPIPISQPRGELSYLLSVDYPQLRSNDIILSKKISDQLNKILTENRNNERLRSFGLEPNRKILLIGPPGCGKTMTASVIAGELGLPLFTIRLDGLITKFMGETSSKLRLVFDEIKETKGVYLFDEFDAIGSQRSFINDVGEIRRVLNSFLIFIEHDKSLSLIIAATNYPQNLDYALFRRFHTIIEYKLPDLNQIKSLLKNRFYRKEINAREINKIANEAKGLSYGEITNICDEAFKEMIIKEENFINIDNLISLIQEKKIIREIKNNNNG